MRIRNGATKVTLVIAGYALALLAGITVGVSTRSGWGVVVSSGIILLVVFVLTRLFRGENESDAPRPWWRTTARPTVGYVLAAWFLLQGIGGMSSSALGSASAGWVSAGVSLIIAVAYLNSAIRLTAIDRPRKEVRA